LESEPLPTYIQYHSPHGATRLYRFYISLKLQRRRPGIEIIPVAFTDRYVVALRITVYGADFIASQGGRKMDPLLITKEHLKKKNKLLVGEMAESQTTLSRYNHVVGEVCEKHLQVIIHKEQNERNEDYKLMENHLNQCIYDILRSDIT